MFRKRLIFQLIQKFERYNTTAALNVLFINGKEINNKDKSTGLIEQKQDYVSKCNCKL